MIKNNIKTKSLYKFFQSSGWKKIFSSSGYHEFVDEHINVVAIVWTKDNACQIYGDGIQNKMTISYPGGQFFDEINNDFLSIIYNKKDETSNQCRMESVSIRNPIK